MEVEPARPITAMILGLVVGLSIAVLAQQAGLWPLDKLTTFLFPALVALIFIMLAGFGRVASPVPIAIALILLVAPVAYGLTGIGEVGENGQLNGGCTVEALSDLDTTIVTDTSRSSPFDIDPDRGLSWVAISPGPITDHAWEIWVVIGGFEYVVADGAEANDDMDTTNEGDVPDLRAYVEGLGFRGSEQIQGIYEVGGFIDGEGGECDGFGFVRIEGNFLGTIISWIALLLGLIALIIFLVSTFAGRNPPLPEDGDILVVTGARESAGAAVGGEAKDDEAPDRTPDEGFAGLPDEPGDREDRRRDDS